MTKEIFVILGMARSGTSVIARGLKALGIDLGARLTPSSTINPKGFWEDNDIVYEVNEKLLSTLNFTWDSIRPIRSIDFSLVGVQQIQQKALQILQQRTADTDCWGFKDPRTSKLLAFWQPIFSQANVNAHYIIALRNPLSAAQSYQRITGTDIEHGLLLWFVHTLAALQGTIGKSRLLVSYDLMLQDPAAQLARVKQCFGLTSTAETEINQFVKNFLDKDLYRFDNKMTDLRQHPAIAIVPECLSLYEQLFAIADDQADFNSPAFLMAYDKAQKICEQQYPFYHYLDTLLSRSQGLQYAIRKLHQSRLWRLIKPLRMVDDWLRDRRKAQKARLNEQRYA